MGLQLRALCRRRLPSAVPQLCVRHLMSLKRLLREPSGPAGYLDYSAEETARFQEAFRPTVERYRRRRRIVLLTGGVTLGLLFGTLIGNGISELAFNKAFFKGDLPWYIQATILAGFLISGVAFITLPRLRCPLCGGFLDTGVGRYCPECGADGLESDISGRPHCKACGVTMLKGNYGRRLYRVRACTSCGLLVDPEGF